MSMMQKRAEKNQRVQSRVVKSVVKWTSTSGRDFIMQWCHDHPEHVPTLEKFAQSLTAVHTEADGDEKECFGRGTTFVHQVNKRYLGEILSDSDPERIPQNLMDALATQNPGALVRLFTLLTGYDGDARISDAFSRVKVEFERTVQEAVGEHGGVAKKIDLDDHFEIDRKKGKVTDYNFSYGGIWCLMPPMEEGADPETHEYEYVTHVIEGKMNISDLLKETTVHGTWTIQKNWKATDAILESPGQDITVNLSKAFKKAKVKFGVVSTEDKEAAERTERRNLVPAPKVRSRLLSKRAPPTVVVKDENPARAAPVAPPVGDGRKKARTA